MAFLNEYSSLLIYTSDGKVYYINLESKNIFYTIENLPIIEKAKKMMVINNNLMFITIDGKIKIFKLQISKDKLIETASIILEITEEVADFFDAECH